jgi:hypothetical protein
MKKFYLLLVSVVLLHNPKSVIAENIAACDLTYVCLGGNDYLITVAYFRSCGDIFPLDSIEKKIGPRFGFSIISIYICTNFSNSSIEIH